MKRIYLLLTFLLICGVAFGAPTPTATRPVSYTTGSTIDADDQNSNENTIYTQYNAHTHGDLTKTNSVSWTVGANTDTNHRFIADNGDTNNPEIRYIAGKNRWSFSNDGVTFVFMVSSANVGVVRGTIDGFNLVWEGKQIEGGRADSKNVQVGAGSMVISGAIFSTTGTTQNLSIASNHAWIGGSKDDTANAWIYVYGFDDGSGTSLASFNFSKTAPDAVDESGNTGGINKFYTTGGTTYRCIGSVRTDAHANVASFNAINDIVMWNVPVVITTSVSDNAWSSALSCAAAIPAISTRGIFGLHSDAPSGDAGIFVRPNGSTWLVNDASGIKATSTKIGGQRTCITDDSQQIQYFNDTGDDATTVMVEGYEINIL